jgi:hypothetical protein
VRLIECRQPRDLDIWLHSLVHVGEIGESVPAAEEAGAIWTRIRNAPATRTCTSSSAAGSRCSPRSARATPVRMAELASDLLANQDRAHEREPRVPADGRNGRIRGVRLAAARAHALELLLEAGAEELGKPVFRLLRCHASRAATRIARTFFPQLICFSQIEALRASRLAKCLETGPSQVRASTGRLLRFGTSERREVRDHGKQVTPSLLPREVRVRISSGPEFDRERRPVSLNASERSLPGSAGRRREHCPASCRG